MEDLQKPENAEFREKLLFTVHLGNFVESGAEFAHWKNHLFNPAIRLMREVPYLPVAGSRDYVLNPTLLNFRRYLDFPGEVQGQYNQVNYRIDFGRTRLMIGDTGADGNSSLEYDDRILQWADEIKADDYYDWRFAFYHFPGYTKALPPGSGLTDYRIQNVREALFNTYNPNGYLDNPALRVTFIASSHNHMYERSGIGDVEEERVMQFVLGGGGHPLRDWPEIWSFVDSHYSNGASIIPNAPTPEEGWLGYAFVLVKPDRHPGKVLIRARNYTYHSNGNSEWLEEVPEIEDVLLDKR
jgi:hypothetical protein